MSPTERELRAALHSGEGQALDADAMIVRAGVLRRERQARRVRLVSISAAVVVVAAVGTGGGLLLTRGHSTSESSGALTAIGAAQSRDEADATASPGAAAGTSVGSGNPAASAAPLASGAPLAPGATEGSEAPEAPGASEALREAEAVACPAARPPTVATVNSTGPLISGSVAALRVCVYAEPQSSSADSSAATDAGLNTVYTGAAALDIAAGLNAAATTPSPFACRPLATPYSVLVIPISVDGTPGLGVEFTQGDCEFVVSNGRVTRYAGGAPAGLGPFLATVESALDEGGATRVPPHAQGSPVSS